MKNNISKPSDLSIRTLRIRIKDKHAKALKSMAFACQSGLELL